MVDLVVSGSPKTVFEHLLRIKSVITFRKNNGWPLFQEDEEWRYQSEDDDRVCPICTGFDIDMFFRGDEIPERFPTFERRLNEGTATLHPHVHQNPEFAWLKGDCRCRMFMRNIELTLERRLHADKLQVI